MPDAVPFMLDLSHWFYQKHRLPWDLTFSYDRPEYALIDYHRKAGAGFYMPNLGSFYVTEFPGDVKAETEKRQGSRGPEIVWRLRTPLGSIDRARTWEEKTYAWGISRWGISNEQQLRIFTCAMGRRHFAPHWDRYRAWVDYLGDGGVVYLSAGYSAVGHLLNYWMGVEAAAYATVDFPGALREAVEVVNDNNLDLIDLLCDSPAEIIMMGDNFSSDIQSPPFFDEWSRPFYTEAVRRLHEAGKCVAVHIDGRLKGAIRMIRDTGADCGDAITPTPMGDLSPAQCREEAGPDFILSGGVSPDLWLPQTPVEMFKERVIEWLAQKAVTPRFIAGAGDQVPPGAEEERIAIMRDLVEDYGRY